MVFKVGNLKRSLRLRLKLIGIKKSFPNKGKIYYCKKVYNLMQKIWLGIINGDLFTPKPSQDWKDHL